MQLATMRWRFTCYRYPGSAPFCNGSLLCPSVLKARDLPGTREAKKLCTEFHGKPRRWWLSKYLYHLRFPHTESLNLMGLFAVRQN